MDELDNMTLGDLNTEYEKNLEHESRKERQKRRREERLIEETERANQLSMFQSRLIYETTKRLHESSERRGYK